MKFDKEAWINTTTGRVDNHYDIKNDKKSVHPFPPF